MSRNAYLLENEFLNEVTSRKGRVSRNSVLKLVHSRNQVTSRKGRVSRNISNAGKLKSSVSHVP